ncbi:MAG: FAD-binding protein [Hyphomicrobium sp.]|nr:electron transfer flavoprotein subunit alpha/FixB family protein [Hyphomicrobium sp.]
MPTLVLAEHTNSALSPSTGKALSAALAMGGDIHILVAGSDCKVAADAAAKLGGVSKVLVADAAHLANGLAEEVAEVILGLAGSYDAILAPATASGKNILPRVAAILDVMQISDITKVISADTFERPIYAGNAIQTVQSAEAKKIITVRTSAFPAAAEGGSAAIETVTVPGAVGSSRFESAELTKSDRPELTSAKIIISGGRGMGNGENFTKYIEPVADRLGAAMGASRAAVDAGFVPNDLQVGQTGKVVAPDLYVAVGISGAIQHLAGMKDSKVIVAINKDGEAPIFQVADYGLVADLFQALPELEAELKKAGH